MKELVFVQGSSCILQCRSITGGTSRVEGKQNSLFPLGPLSAYCRILFSFLFFF